MATFYAVITKFANGKPPSDLSQRSEKVKQALLAQVPSLTGKWIAKYALDHESISAIDIVASDNRGDVDRAARIIGELGGADTEVVAAATWPHFLSGSAFS